MQTTLYEKLFARLDELGAIRKDLTLGCEVSITFASGAIQNHIVTKHENGDTYTVDRENPFKEESGLWMETMEIIGHPPILSDCINATHPYPPLIRDWDYFKPYLHQQSDELGEKLFELLS